MKWSSDGVGVSTRTPVGTAPSAVQVRAVDGVTTVLHDFGGEGPTLLFAHATGLHGWVWKPVADHLVHRAHCLAMDLRGHGDSRLVPGTDLSWDGFALDTLAGARAVDRGNVIGIGHSLGGAALLDAEIMSPGTFRHLFLYEPAVHPDLPEQQRNSLIEAGDEMTRIANRRRAEFVSLGDALAHYVDRPPMAQFQAAVLGAYVRHGFSAAANGGVELKCAPETEAAIYAGYNHDAVNRLGAITCPVTLATGADTEDFQRHNVEALSAQLEAAPVVLRGADRFGPMQQPKQFAQVVARHVLDT
jgi:pimeloyl-ACP methyl ester carboxylesterase